MNTEGRRGLALLEQRLDEPETAEQLSRLLDRLGAIERSLERMETAISQAPAAISMVADVVDEAADRAQSDGVDVDARLRHSLQMVDKLTEPRTLDAITGLLERMEKIEALTSLLDDLPGFAAMMVDAIDEIYRGAESVGIDIDARVRSTFALGEKLTAPEAVEALDEVLDPNAIGFVGMLGDTLARCQRLCLERPEPYSQTLFGTLKSARDPDVRRALGFLTMFAKQFGQGMQRRHEQLKLNATSDHES